jgi:ABC-type nitrate/sulfonate/bicarbonate transport system substrate-binding protein
MVLVLSLAILFSFTACNQQDAEIEEADLEQITFTLDWFPNTNHTGVYVAEELGYFYEAGLDVEIIQPGESTAEQLVAADSAQFGISYQESVTFARAQDIPIVSVASVIQHNTSGFASLASKGIESPADFEGKKYGGWGSDIEDATIAYLMEQYGADPSTVENVTIGDVDFFAASESGEVDFTWVFEGWTGIEAELNGYELNYIDLGKEAEVFDYYTPVIITSEKNIEDNTEMVEAFMDAVLRGYEYAINNPEEAAEILIQYVPELDAELVKTSQVFLSKNYQADANYWGEQKTSVWENYTNWLFENGFIEEDIDVNEAFTNQFVEK